MLRAGEVIGTVMAWFGKGFVFGFAFASGALTAARILGHG